MLRGQGITGGIIRFKDRGLMALLIYRTQFVLSVPGLEKRYWASECNVCVHAYAHEVEGIPCFLWAVLCVAAGLESCLCV